MTINHLFSFNYFEINVSCLSSSVRKCLVSTTHAYIFTVYIPNKTCNRFILREVDSLFIVKYSRLQYNNTALTFGTLNQFAICLICISLITVIRSDENI